MLKHVVAVLGALVSVGLAAGAGASDTEGLQTELTPYLWAAGVDGEGTVGPRTVHFNESFSDLISDVDAAFMGLGVVSYDRFVLYVDYDYISLSTDGKLRSDLVFPSGIKTKSDATVKLGTYAGGYRFDTWGKNTIDVLFGAQVNDTNVSLKVLGSNLSNKSNAHDTVVLLRPSIYLAEHWRLNPTFAYGISGDADETYTLMPQVQWDMSDSFALRFGYKRFHIKEDSGTKGTLRYQKLDADLEGFFVGVGWTFRPH